MSSATLAPVLCLLIPLAVALRILILSQRLLGTRDIVLVKHTEYGMLAFDNAHLHGLLMALVTLPLRRRLIFFRCLGQFKRQS